MHGIIGLPPQMEVRLRICFFQSMRPLLWNVWWPSLWVAVLMKYRAVPCKKGWGGIPRSASWWDPNFRDGGVVWKLPGWRHLPVCFPTFIRALHSDWKIEIAEASAELSFPLAGRLGYPRGTRWATETSRRNSEVEMCCFELKLASCCLQYLIRIPLGCIYTDVFWECRKHRTYRINDIWHFCEDLESLRREGDIVIKHRATENRNNNQHYHGTGQFVLLTHWTVCLMSQHEHFFF